MGHRLVSEMWLILGRFFVVAGVGTLFLAFFAWLFTATDLVPESQQGTVYLVGMTPWTIWGVLYFGIPLVKWFWMRIRKRGR
jgi:hypothetical protein